MVDFAAHFPIHAIKIGFQIIIVHFTWKVLSLKVVHLPIAYQSECINLGRISDLFSVHLSSSHTLLAAKKRFRVA